MRITVKDELYRWDGVPLIFTGTYKGEFRLFYSVDGHNTYVCFVTTQNIIDAIVSNRSPIASAFSEYGLMLKINEDLSMTVESEHMLPLSELKRYLPREDVYLSKEA